MAGLFAAAFPLWFYITTDYTRLLAAFAVVIFAGHFVINTRTLVIATRALSRDFLPDRWQTLISGDLDARHIVLGKWWAVVRHVWRWHLLTGIMKAGLALALAQHIHDSALRGICSSPFHFLCYVNPYPDDTTNIQPALYKVVLAFFIVMGYSVLEPGLITALGFLAALVARFRRVSPGFVAIILYLLLIVAVIGLAVELDWYTTKLAPYIPRYWDMDRIHEAGIINAGVVGLPLIGDGGTLVAANLLRPYEPSGFNTVRNVVVAIFSFMIYGAGIGGMLRLVRIIAVKYGAVPPPKPSYAYLKSWLNNPIAHDQHRTFSQKGWLQNRWLQVIALAVFALLLLIAWLPRWYHPLYCDQAATLRLITGIVVAVHGAVFLRTLLLATNAMRRDAEENTWDPLVLTLIDSRQLVLGKWWAVLRSVWMFYVAGAALKMGLLYGLAQYISDTPINPSAFTRLEEAFYYISANFISQGSFPPCGGYHNYHFAFYPTLKLLVQWGIILVVFSLLEAALLVAVGLLGALVIRRNAAFQLALAITLRAAPIVCAIFIIQTCTPLIMTLPDWYEVNGYGIPPAWDKIEPRNWSLTLETTQIALSTQFDGGLVSVNLTGHYYNIYSHRRQWLGLSLGASLYLLLTFLALRAAEKIAIRRGALPPPPFLFPPYAGEEPP